MKRLITIVLVVLILIGMWIFLYRNGWRYLERATYGDWNKTYAAYPSSGAASTMIQGYTDEPVTGGWNVALLWKKEDDVWLVYFLDEKSSGWNNYALKQNGAQLDVYQNSQLLGKLNPTTGEFLSARQNFMPTKPIRIIHGSHLDDFEQWAFWAGQQ